MTAVTRTWRGEGERERAVDGWRGTKRGGGSHREVGLITVPSAFALRRIRQPYLPVIL